MFEFTTTHVINSLTDLTTGEDLILNGTNSVTVKRAGIFKNDECTGYKKKAYSGDKEVLEIKLNNLSTNNETYRLNLKINLSQGSNSSYYANDSYFKYKPFTFEYVGKGEDTAAELVETIKKMKQDLYGERMFNVYEKENVKNTLVIEAVDEYQRFHVTIEHFEEKEGTYFGGEYTEMAKLDRTKGSDSIFTLVPGKEAFGSYSYMIRNLRIPTQANTAPFKVQIDEVPVIGATYDQYTIHKRVNRGTLGLNAVGHQVESVTTHVFYVNSAIAETFELKFNGVVTFEEVKQS